MLVVLVLCQSFIFSIMQKKEILSVFFFYCILIFLLYFFWVLECDKK